MVSNSYAAAVVWLPTENNIYCDPPEFEGIHQTSTYDMCRRKKKAESGLISLTTKARLNGFWIDFREREKKLSHTNVMPVRQNFPLGELLTDFLGLLQISILIACERDLFELFFHLFSIESPSFLFYGATVCHSFQVVVFTHSLNPQYMGLSYSKEICLEYK